MFELLAGMNQDDSSQYIYDFDFSKQALGDKTIINHGTGPQLTRFYGPNGATTEHGVVDLPGYGRAFYFNGLMWFGLKENTTGNLFAGNFEITAEFKSVTTKNETLFATGCYSSRYILDGVLLYLNGNLGTYVQLFVNTPGKQPSFTRYVNSRAQPASKADSITVRKALTSVQITDSSGITTTTNARDAPAQDTAVSVGGGIEGLYQGTPDNWSFCFNGWLKRLTVKKL